MIINSTPITTSATFDQLFVSNLTLVPNSYLFVNAYASDGTHTLRTPIKSLHKKVSEIVEIHDILVAEAFRQANLSIGCLVKRITINTKDIDAAIHIRVDAVDPSNKQLTPWMIQDARQLFATDQAFAAIFSENMAAIGALF